MAQILKWEIKTKDKILSYLNLSAKNKNEYFLGYFVIFFSLEGCYFCNFMLHLSNSIIKCKIY